MKTFSVFFYPPQCPIPYVIYVDAYSKFHAEQKVRLLGLEQYGQPITVIQTYEGYQHLP